MEIKLERVGFTYQSISNYVALKNINMKIEEGKITGLIGSSGSGKTTLLELIDGLLIPTHGKIKVGDFVFSKTIPLKNSNEMHSKIGFVFQFPETQFFNPTVRQELEVPLNLFHYKLDQKEQRIKDALLMMEMDESFLDRDPYTLSNGEKRKIAIASVLVYNPKVLLLDEPTIGLDYQSKKSLIRLLVLLKKRYNKTILIATHDVDLIHKIADYIYILADKTILLEGDKYSVLKQVDLLKEHNIEVPKVIEFSDLVLKKKNKKIGYRDDINDLIKDIYRYAK